MPPRRSPSCPRCGFSFAWNGRKCGHCPPPSRARQLWEEVHFFPELVGYGENIPPGPLLSIALACLQRVLHLLPESERELAARLESTPGLVPRRRIPLPEGELDVVGRLVAAVRRDGVLDANAVQAVARSCSQIAAGYAFPNRDLHSFPLPAELEPFRAGITLGAHGYPEARDADAAAALEHLHHQQSEWYGRHQATARAEEFAQCEIARDVLGFPEVTVTFSPAWRTSTVVAMARGAHESRDFGSLPILADALQDAGCEEPEILEHCRGERPHVRGCWVLDGILDNRRN